MSEILILARDYIERMANPVYGSSVNEEYSIRFATLLSLDGFESRLNEEISGLKDRNTLTSYGWLWLLEWAKSRQISLDEELLVGLFEEWSSVFVRSDIVDVATQRSDEVSGNFRNFSVKEFPSTFLSRIMVRATRLPEEVERQESQKFPEENRKRETVPSTAMAESALISFMQVGRPITLDASAVLLRDEWQGQQHLLRYFWAKLDSIDEETRANWIKRLDPPSLRRVEH
jgi:hypothetical protein